MKTGWATLFITSFLFIAINARCAVRYLDIIYQLDGFPRAVCNVNSKIIQDGEVADIMCRIDCLCTDSKLTCCDRSKRLCQDIDGNCPAVVFNFNTRQTWLSTVHCKREVIQYFASGSSDNENIEPPPPPDDEHPIEPLKIAIDPEPESRLDNSIPDSSNLDGRAETVPPPALIDPNSDSLAHPTSPRENKEETTIPPPVVKVTPKVPVITAQTTNNLKGINVVSKDVYKPKKRRKPSMREAKKKARQERKRRRKEGRRRIAMQRRAGRLKEIRRRQEEKKRAFLESKVKAKLDREARKRSRQLQRIEKQLAAQKKREERQAARLARIAKRKKRKLAYVKKKTENKLKREERRKKKAEKAKRRAANLIKRKSNMLERKRRQKLRAERYRKRKVLLNT